jgi:hypothetical protein
MMKILNISYLLLSLLFLTACDALERDIEIELPEPERILSVECYLEAGKPYRVLLTETKGFFEELDACPLVKNATVIIKHNGIADTLTEAIYFSDNCPADSLFGFIPFFNADYTRFYNYGSNSICPLDYDHDFEIEVIDPDGDRYVTASTRFLPPVPIDTMTATFRAGDTLASVFIEFFDDAATVDFYRVMLHKRSLTKEGTPPFVIAKNPEFDVTLDDARFFNGEKITFGTAYDYAVGDTLIATCYHIDQAYHDFLETLGDAEAANFSPFAQPTLIQSNIIGGQGVFTTLSYDRDTLIVSQ